MFNNCFTIGGINKQACYIDHCNGYLKPLNKKNKSLLPLWSRSYKDIKRDIEGFDIVIGTTDSGKEVIQIPTVSLYLENAKYNDLYVFVIDIDTKHETPFINRVIEAANFYTTSKNNGKHAYFGVRRDKELFDSINLLSSKNAKGFITKTGLKAEDETKFDVFCDAPHFIYEWQTWGNKPLTDKTQIVFDLLKDIKINRSVEYDCLNDAEGNDITLEALSENDMLDQMNERQRLIFEDLKAISADCKRNEWFTIGCNISVAFPYDDEAFFPDLGGSVFLWWSKQGESFKSQSCANTWGTICSKERTLNNSMWAKILEVEVEVEVNAFDLPQKDIKTILIQEEVREQHKEHKKSIEQTAKIKEKPQEDKGYKALAAKEQFLFGDLLIQRQKDSTSFLLPNENSKKVTAYKVIKMLTGNAFKSYCKKTKWKNKKIQILPYSERIRIVFFFRQYYRKPPLLDNAGTIAAFINTAIKYTNNIELNRNWSACLDVTNTQEEAVSLLSHYGWAAKYDKEFPPIENAFYTVDVRSGARHYNIVNDNIIMRFAAIEWQGRIEAYEIISNKKLSEDEKRNKLQELLKPLLWWRNGIKMGLTTEAREQCDERISKYINSLLEHNAFDCIPLDEHINNIEIDKSDTGIVWAEPQQFTISMEDMEFLDYQYNINAEYNKRNAAKQGAARSEKAAERNMEKVSGNIGDILTTKELYALGIDKDKIPRLIKNGKIERIKRGYYRIISS